MEVIKKYLFRKPLLTKRFTLSSPKGGFTLSLPKGAVFILALLVFGVATPSGFADAGIFGEIINFAAGSFTFLPAFLFLFALQLILTLSSFLALAAGLLLEGVIAMPIFFTKCPDANPCFLDTAWSLMRDIVNMLLIIILVVIAFATMLRREELGARKALIPLIAVAILVNFSRVIVGVVVDVSSLVMGVFLPQITGVSALTDSLAAQKGIILDQLDSSTFKISDQILAIFKTLTLIIFQMAYAFILALYAVIFLVRFVALWLLTIFSPIAFVAFILPITRKKIFDEWRNQLISWSFMGVTAVFFLWLGKLFSQSIGKYGETFSSGEIFDKNTLLGEFLLEIFPYIFLLIFLYVTFMLALKTNAVGAGMIINAAKKAGGAAGIATGKFAGRMAQRGAMVGARKAAPIAGRFGRAAFRKTLGPLSVMGPWKPGAAAKRYDKNLASREEFLKRTKLWGKKDRNGNVISEKTAWGSLTKEQQDSLVQQNRSKAAKAASAILGGGRNLAKLPFSMLTPEEKKALWSAITFEKIRAANKKSIEDAMNAFENFTEKELKKTILLETNSSKRLAAEILLLQKHGTTLSNDEKKRINKSADKIGLGKETLPNLDEKTLRDEYRDPTQQARKLRTASEGAFKKIEEAFKSMESLSNDVLRKITETSTNIHDKLAAFRRLADNKSLTRSDFDSFEKLVQNFDQFAQVAKRYPHFADISEISNITEKMSRQDYQKIHEDLFDDANRAKFEKFYTSATSEGFLEAFKNDAIRQKIQAMYSDAAKAAFLKTNPGIDNVMTRRRRSPLGDPRWP